MIDHDVGAALTDDARAFLDDIELSSEAGKLDVFVLVRRSKEDPLYGDASGDPAFDWHEQWGIEHSGEWLKGIAVLKLGETRVGLRIRS